MNQQTVYLSKSLCRTWKFNYRANKSGHTRSHRFMGKLISAVWMCDVCARIPMASFFSYSQFTSSPAPDSSVFMNSDWSSMEISTPADFWVSIDWRAQIQRIFFNWYFMCSLRCLSDLQSWEHLGVTIIVKCVYVSSYKLFNQNWYKIIIENVINNKGYSRSNVSK